MGLAEIEAQRRGVRLEVDVPEGLPRLLADPILIEQVLLNLVRNGLEALDSARHRRLQIRVTRLPEWLEFAVIDTGTGLAPGAREKLFQPFFTTKKEGMGMGLNICRSIIEAHKGRLWVENNPAAGCTFKFMIPITSATTVARAA